MTFFLTQLPAKRTAIMSNEHRHVQSCITKSYSCHVTVRYNWWFMLLIHAARMHQLYSRKWPFKGWNTLELRTELIKWLFNNIWVLMSVVTECVITVHWCEQHTELPFFRKCHWISKTLITKSQFVVLVIFYVCNEVANRPLSFR